MSVSTLDLTKQVLTLAELQRIVSDRVGLPVALRMEGDVCIVCPYCNETHDHGDDAGHRSSHCAAGYSAPTPEEISKQKKIAINGRVFTHHHGYYIINYERRNDLQEDKREWDENGANNEMLQSFSTDELMMEIVSRQNARDRSKAHDASVAAKTVVRC